MGVCCEQCKEDHDAVIALKTIITNDHEPLKLRVAALEAHAARATGIAFVLAALMGIFGVVLGAVLAHVWK